MVGPVGMEDGEAVGGRHVGSVGDGIDFACDEGDGIVAQMADAEIGADGGHFVVVGGVLVEFPFVICYCPLSWAGHGLPLDGWVSLSAAAAVVYSLDDGDDEWIDLEAR